MITIYTLMYLYTYIYIQKAKSVLNISTFFHPLSISFMVINAIFSVMCILLYTLYDYHFTQ